MRFLFAWQHVEPSSRLSGIDGLRAALESLDGFELAADAWERAVLPDRVDGYQPSMLDTLCLTGEVGWARLSSSARDATQLVGATPVALFLREHGDAWQTLREPDVARPFPPSLKLRRTAEALAEAGQGRERGSERPALQDERDDLGETARVVLDALRARGALFVAELITACGLDEAGVRDALADPELAAVLFASGSAVRGFLDLGGSSRLPAITIGPRTTNSARELGFVVIAEADAQSVSGLADAVVRALPMEDKNRA